MTDMELKMACLELASKSEVSAAEVVERADLYFKFLMENPPAVNDALAQTKASFNNPLGEQWRTQMTKA